MKDKTESWDDKASYLDGTRFLYHNDDYLEFLIKSVWGLTEPVSVLDWGCGTGYMARKLLPVLPSGSSSECSGP